MKLKIKQLKQFNAIAGSMRQNNVLPILSYLKFEEGQITKNNLESFVTMEADFEGSVLIDEKILMSFVDSVNADEIDVKVNGTRVTLSHGKEKFNASTEPVINFPKSAESDGESVEVDSDILRSVKVASNFTMERDNMPYANCVFIGDGVVGAVSGFIAYVESIRHDLPQIILEKQAVSVIRNFNTVQFSQNDSYQFFLNGIFKFGFIKKDTKYIDMRKFLKLPEAETVSMKKTELQSFCEACISVSSGRVISAKVDGKMATMTDADYGNDYEKPLPASMPHFLFNPVYMGKLLKSLPDEELKFLKDSGKLFITGAGNYSSIIMEQF